MLYPILVHERWGFIDRSGREVVPPRYESTVAAELGRVDGSPHGRQKDDLFMSSPVEPESTAIVAVRDGAKWGFVDRLGQLLPLRFDEIEAFGEGLAPVRQGERWGFVGESGTITIPLMYDLVEAFVNGIAIVSQDSQFGAIDPAGHPVLRTRFESLQPADSLFHDNRALVTMSGKKGYVSRAGTIALPPMYEDAEPFSEGLAAVTRRGKTGYIDTTGRMVIAPRTWTVESFSHGRALVLVGDRYGYIGRDGAYVTRPQFTDARSFTSDGALAWKGPVQGTVNLAGRWSVTPYKELQRLDDSLSVAVMAGRTGLVRRATSEMIREYPWQEVGPFSEGLMFVRGSNGRLGFIDLEGHVVIPPRFSRAGQFDHGLCKVTTRDSLGYIDPSGAWIWSTRFR